MDPLGRILHLTNTATTPYKNEPALAPGLLTGRRSWVKEGMDSTLSPPHLDLRAWQVRDLSRIRQATCHWPSGYSGNIFAMGSCRQFGIEANLAARARVHMLNRLLDFPCISWRSSLDKAVNALVELLLQDRLT